jgi:FAD/FMN-containing dehydrogenase
LKVDKQKMVALVEPNVSMDSLVNATLAHGLLPPVVMEFPGITAGGGFAGTAGESSSFKYGLFDCTVRSIEVILADGTIVAASESENPDLFYGTAGSCGTLGVVTMLEVRLIDARQFVELTYHTFDTTTAALEAIERATHESSIDYIDGIVFAPNRSVVMTGRLTDMTRDGIAVRRFTRARDPWFYLHVEKVTKPHSAPPVTELIPIVDYLFRYDRGAFWGGAHAIRYFKTPFNRITRFVLDPFMRTRVMYHALHESGLAQQTIVQDLAFPFSTVQAFIDYVHSTFHFYPLWLCPLRPSPHWRQNAQHLCFAIGKNVPREAAMLCNVGVWGMGPTNHDRFVALNRALEQRVRELRGVKTLYAHAYYTEEEFWAIYDWDAYSRLRAKYRAESLPTVYEKVRAKVTATTAQQRGASSRRTWLAARFWKLWPMSGLWGIWKAAIGVATGRGGSGDYVLAK